MGWFPDRATQNTANIRPALEQFHQALYCSSFPVPKAFSSIQKRLNTPRALLCWLWCPGNCSAALGELGECQIFQFRPSLHHQFTKKELEHSRGPGYSTFSSEAFSNRTHLRFQAGKNKHECFWNECFSTLPGSSAAPFSPCHVFISLGSGEIQL